MINYLVYLRGRGSVLDIEAERYKLLKHDETGQLLYEFCNEDDDVVAECPFENVAAIVKK